MAGAATAEFGPGTLLFYVVVRFMGYRQFIIRLFTFLGGVYFFLHFVLPEEIRGVKFSAYHDQISNGFIAIGTMAVGLGLINLFLFHGSKLVFVKHGWINSLALLIGLFFMIAISFADWQATDQISRQAQRFYVLRDFTERIAKDYHDGNLNVPVWSDRNKALLSATRELVEDVNNQSDLLLQDRKIKQSSDKIGVTYADQLQTELTATVDKVRQIEAVEDPLAVFELHKELIVNLITAGALWSELSMLAYDTSLTKLLYRLLFEGLFVALGSAMFALLGFYIAAAAYRAFRIRSIESGLMMAAALIVMLGQIPFGVWLWEGFPELRLWLLAEPNTAVARAISIGAGVAGLLMAFRMWFSIESDRFGDK